MRGFSETIKSLSFYNFGTRICLHAVAQKLTTVVRQAAQLVSMNQHFSSLIGCIPSGNLISRQTEGRVKHQGQLMISLSFINTQN